MIDDTQNGATPEECDFLVRKQEYRSWSGERVELNAMTSDQLITWLEKKLHDLGVEKVVPKEDVLAKAYQRALGYALIQKAAEEALEQGRSVQLSVPDNLLEKIKNVVRDSDRSREAFLWELAQAKVKQLN